MLDQSRQHEQKFTSKINKFAAMAREDNDFGTISRLTWFIDEQVEEEDTARAMIQAFRPVESNDYGMYMLDNELAGRTYAAPSPLASAE